MTSTRRSSEASNPRPIDGRDEGGRRIVLGVDPGSIITGYGVISAGDGKISAVDWGVIRARKADRLPKRFLTILQGLLQLIDAFAPHCVAIERAFYGKNIASLITMGQAVGVALLAAEMKDVESREYTPREVKKSVAGRGGASKEQIQRMVCSILGLGGTTESLDATAALAVALCHEKRMKDDYLLRGPASRGAG